MTYRVGIDIGGTFTDFALMGGEGSGQVHLYKNLTTPADLSQGVMSGLERLAQMEGLDLGAFLAKCAMIVHGTTIADNALIEISSPEPQRPMCRRICRATFSPKSTLPV